jgi:curved DNA-binding protein CbpA
MAKFATSNLIETLLETAKTSCSGVIRFERGPSKKQLVLRSGLVTFAESNAPEEHLVRVLVEMNLLKRTQVAEVAKLMKAGKPVEEAVQGCSKLDDAGLLSGAREQAATILASVFGWTDFEMRFFPGENLVRRKIDLSLPVPELVLEAVRSAVSSRLVPGLNKPLQGWVSLPKATRADLLGLPLNGAEAFAFSQVREMMPVENLLPLLPAGDAKPEDLVRRLVLSGLVCLEDAPPATDVAQEAGCAELVATADLEEMLQRFEVANHYEILSVAADATEEEIKQAYHELAKRYHPDRFQTEAYSGAIRSLVGKVFTFVTGAYTTLSDPAARAAYEDTRLKKESQVEATLQARAATDTEQEKMAETLFRAGRQSLTLCDYEKAVQQLKECVWLRPSVARYRHYLGLAQAEIPRLRKEAEQNLLKALELDDTSVDSRLALAKLYTKCNLPRRAEIRLHEVLTWDPGNQEAQSLLNQLGGTAAEMHNLSERSHTSRRQHPAGKAGARAGT